mmetsp:Transcript_110470/g.219619  ORF Transcript_110470/g.219619 Transcript_110470/m.219619 type:complete len:382 (+) Transcript_110470:32-1177(+)
MCALVVCDKGNVIAFAPVPVEENTMRGRDAVLQAVLADLQRACDDLHKSEAKVAASEAEVAALRAKLGASDDAVGCADTNMAGIEVLQKASREVVSSARHQTDLLQTSDVEIASLRKQLRESRTEVASLRKDLRETRIAQLQCKLTTDFEAGECCCRLQVDILQAELLRKDSQLQEALSTASRAQQAEERCKTLQSQMQLLRADLPAKSAKLHEALQSTAAEGSVGAHDAEARCKVQEAQVQELQAKFKKTTARCTELESNAERLRTRHGIAEDTDCPEQTPKAAEAASDVAGSFDRCSASELQALPGTRNSSNPEVRQASTSANAAPVDDRGELWQQRKELRRVSSSANSARSDRYEELRQYRKLLTGQVAMLMLEAQES